MLRTDENETEILLGNKQLLGIFLVVAVLLGISFIGGYMAGRGSARKTAPAVEPAAAETSRSETATGGQTHTVPPDATAPDSLKSSGAGSANETTGEPEQPLGARRHNSPKVQPVKESKSEPASAKAAPAPSGESYKPRSGSQYLQVAAVERDEADAIADVLHKKGFRAHAVPKPGSNKLYRVIIGPIRDAGDLRSTRDALHNTGFREVIVQRY